MRAKVENCQCWGALIEGHLGSMLVKGTKKQHWIDIRTRLFAKWVSPIEKIDFIERKVWRIGGECRKCIEE